jgi:hypothetical protein
MTCYNIHLKFLYTHRHTSSSFVILDKGSFKIHTRQKRLEGPASPVPMQTNEHEVSSLAYIRCLQLGPVVIHVTNLYQAGFAEEKTTSRTKQAEQKYVINTKAPSTTKPLPCRRECSVHSARLVRIDHRNKNLRSSPTGMCCVDCTVDQKAGVTGACTVEKS